MAHLVAVEGDGAGGPEHRTFRQTGSGVEAAGHVDGENRIFDQCPAGNRSGELAAEAGPEQRVHHQVCAKRIAPGADGYPGGRGRGMGPPGAVRAGLGERQHLDRRAAPVEVPGGHVAVTAVVARPGQDHHPAAVAGAHPDRRQRHGEAGAFHQHFDGLGRPGVEFGSLGGAQHRFHETKGNESAAHTPVMPTPSGAALSALPPPPPSPWPSRPCA